MCGKSLPRRTRTSLSLDKNKICPFNFSISWDEKGYYLLQTAGKNLHKHHPRIDPKTVAIPGHLIDDDTKETILHMSQACIESSAGANYVHAKLDRHISRASIAYMQDSTFDASDNMPKSDIESLLQMFQDSLEISYSVLWDSPCTNEESNDYSRRSNSADTPVPQSPTKLISEVQNRWSNKEHTIDHSFDEAYHDIAREVRGRRIAKGLSDQDDKVFIAVAWANADQLRMFLQHPSVLYCDSTGDSNKKAKHLFIMSGRHPSGKQFVFLRAWVHNQKRSTFKWLFHSVLRSFLPHESLCKIQLVLMDGDPQQRGAVESMLRTYFPSSNTQIGTCAWHLISQGFKKNMRSRGTFPESKQGLYDMFVKTLLSWLYSFTRPGYIEDVDEFKISKKLLLRWIKSSKVTQLLGKETSVALREWLVNNIFAYEDYFSLFRRMHLQTFYQATTSPHEGTNFGSKTHSASVKPCHNVDKAGRALALQDCLSSGIHSHNAHSDLIRKPVWSSSSSSKTILTTGESLLSQIYERIKLYEVRQISDCKWEVKFIRDAEDNVEEEEIENDGQDPNNPFGLLIPRFERIRKVSLNDDKTMRCSCCAFESRGIPCVHIGAVLNRCNSNWNGFSHHDCSLCWWKAWNAFSYSANYPSMSQFLLLLESKKISGPLFVGNTSDTNDLPFPAMTKLHSVLNYDIDRLKDIFGEELQLTQDSNFIDTEFLYTQDTHLFDAAMEEESWDADADADAAFEGFMDVATDKTGVLARDLLKHDIQEMYEVLDEFNKLELGIPMANEIREVVQGLVRKMREGIAQQTACKGNGKRHLGNVHYIADEIPRNKYCKRSFHSKNC